ncbi:hypothetical protein TNCV_4546951 [Trichonephila clavipes]|nr:hypothetical protein TNCV_4546951 [Trichonephila clavipes]
MPARQVPPRTSSVVTVIRNGSSHSFSRRLRGTIGNKVLECKKPIEIHRQFCKVYGPNIMSVQMVRRWYRQFSEDRQVSLMKSAVGDRSSSGMILFSLRVLENHRFTMTELSSHSYRNLVA